MKNPFKEKIAAAARRNLTEIAYCVYLEGHETGKNQKPAWGYLEFCRNIKQAHIHGRHLWTSQKEGNNGK